MSFLSFLFRKKQLNVLICGLNGVGKTAIVYKMQGQDVTKIDLKPTIGYLNPSFKYKSYEWLFWDVSGDQKFRGLWKSYYQNVKCVCYVFDVTDDERFDDAKNAFMNMLMDQELKNMPFVVFLNKQDKKKTSTDEFVGKLGLTDFQKQRCNFIASSAINGDGLMEGLDWLAVTIKKLEKKK